MVISKSAYLRYKTCPKLLWLYLNMPDEAVEPSDAQKHIDDGKEVGKYAKLYFKNVDDTTSFKEDGSLDIDNMIGLTNRYLMEDKEVIAEASFSIDGLFCSADLLKKVNDGYEIYEVKATTKVEKEHYLDAAFQKYVLEKKGLKISKVFILHLNKEYRRKGPIDINCLFMAERVDDVKAFNDATFVLEDEIKSIKALMQEKDEPKTFFKAECKGCPYHEHCFKDLPSPNAFDLNHFSKRYDCLNNGIITFSDVQAASNQFNLNKFQKAQIECYLRNEQERIDVLGIKEFLKSIKHPVYHLDFESMEPAIPPCDDAWPYEQIPTQYSLHIEYEDGRLEHKEFLGDSIDPRRGIAEALCRDIPADVCVTAYHRAFERDRLKELAELFPDLRDHLFKIRDNVVDLEVPFRTGCYYNIAMGGRSSIKAVLPALYPDDPELDYHALPVVHNGGEAMAIYPIMLEASPEEKVRIRDGLLKYCCLDTLAMVKVLKKIKDAAK